MVLVRPAGPLNVGAAARAMMNTGFEDLRLLAPAPFRVPEAYRMAVTARSLLDRARTFDDLDRALADRHASFGVTARARHKRPRLSPEEAAAEIRGLLSTGRRVALVFGPEDQGLSSEELDRCDRLVGIPASAALPSYNLAQAVLLLCYTCFRHTGPGLEEGLPPTPATHADRRRIETRALELLRAAGYLTPRREAALRGLVRRLAYRAPLETRDARGILAAIRHLLLVLRRGRDAGKGEDGGKHGKGTPE